MQHKWEVLAPTLEIPLLPSSPYSTRFTGALSECHKRCSVGVCIHVRAHVI